MFNLFIDKYVFAGNCLTNYKPVLLGKKMHYIYVTLFVVVYNDE